MNTLKNNKGLTLVETVIALTLVVILTAAFAGAMGIGLKSEKKVSKLDEAIKISSSIADYIAGKTESEYVFKDIILQSIVLEDGEFEKSLNSFINEVNDSNLESFFKTQLENKKLNIDENNSKISIDKFNNSDNLNLYKLTINLTWEENYGNYNLEFILGDS